MLVAESDSQRICRIFFEWLATQVQENLNHGLDL